MHIFFEPWHMIKPASYLLHELYITLFERHFSYIFGNHSIKEMTPKMLVKVLLSKDLAEANAFKEQYIRKLCARLCYACNNSDYFFSAPV